MDHVREEDLPAGHDYPLPGEPDPEVPVLGPRQALVEPSDGAHELLLRQDARWRADDIRAEKRFRVVLVLDLRKTLGEHDAIPVDEHGTGADEGDVVRRT